MILRDPADPRDRIYVGAAATPIESYDLLPTVLKVENQTITLSCIAQSAMTAVECAVKKWMPAKAINLSALFFYYVIRAVWGRPVKDTGTSLRDWMKQLKKVGSCPESMWPFDATKVNVQPPPECYKAARKWRIKSYARVLDVATMKAAIAAGLPVVFSINLRRGFIQAPHDMAQHAGYMKGLLGNDHIGWHAMTGLAYNAQGLIALNSWGIDFAQRGLVLIPYEMLAADLGDAWVITGIKDWLDHLMDRIKAIFGG